MTDMSNAPPIRPASPGPPPPTATLSDNLRIASERGDVDLVKELLAAGAGFRPDHDGHTALHYSSRDGHLDICRLLIAGGCSINAQDVMGYTPLLRAASQGFNDVLHVLLSSGCDPDLQDEHGNAAIHEACWNGFSKCAVLLTGHNCNVSLTNRAGFTALHLAAQNGHNESSRVLLYAGCSTDLKNNYGDTALHTAARYGHAGVARILISARCRLNEQNKNGDTSLHIASALKRRKIAKILVESGMDVNILNKQGETAIDVAKRKEHPEIILIISTYAPATTPSPPKPILPHPVRRHGDNFGVTFKDEIELADGPVVCPDEDLPIKAEPLKPEKERFLFFFKKKKKDKEKDKLAQSNQTNAGQERHHKSNPDLHQLDHQQQPNKPAVHGFFSQYIPREGVQLYRDLAGNIKQGPIGYAPVCQCGPSLKRLESSILNTKESLHKCVESSHNTLSHRLDRLNNQTSRQAQDLRSSIREGLSKEHNACHARISERLHEERRETEEMVGRVNAGMKEEIETWLHDKLASYGHCLDHHHDDTALPPRNLFMDFPTLGRLVRSRSDETLSVSDYSGKHGKKDFYASRKAAMEQIRGWDVPRFDQDLASKERNNNSTVKNSNSTKMVTRAQIHTPYQGNNDSNNACSSRENILSQNSNVSPTTYIGGSMRASRNSLQNHPSVLQQQEQQQQQLRQQQKQHPIANTPVKPCRASPHRASSQPRVSFSPNQPTHIPSRSTSSPPPNVVPTPVPRSRSNPTHLAQSSNELHNQASYSHPNLHTGGPPDTTERKSVEPGVSSKPVLNGHDRSNPQNRPTGANSDQSGVTGESSSNGSKNSSSNNNPPRIQLTRYQDTYGVRFSRPRTLSSDSLKGDYPYQIPRSRSVENTLEDDDMAYYNSGYVTDSAVRTLRVTQTPNKSALDSQPYNRSTTRYRLPETSAAFNSNGMNSISYSHSDGVKNKSPPPVLPKRNQNYSKANHDSTQLPEDAYDSSIPYRRTSIGGQNKPNQRDNIPPSVPRKGESNFLQNPLPTSLSVSSPMTKCLQHDSFLSPATSPSLPFANGNKEDSTCSSNQDSGYDSRAHKRISERKDGDTSGGTPSSSFSVERSSCNTPSYAGSPFISQKESQPSDPYKRPPEPYGYSQRQFNGNDKSSDNSFNKSMDDSWGRRMDAQSYPDETARDTRQLTFNNSNRNFSQSHFSAHANNRNEYKHPTSVKSHPPYFMPHINSSSSNPSVYDSFNVQHNTRNSQPPPVKDKPSVSVNQPDYPYNTRRQPISTKYPQSKSPYHSNVNNENLTPREPTTKDTNSNAPFESSKSGENPSYPYSSVPSYSASQTPPRPPAPSYRASPFPANNHFSSSYYERGNKVPSSNQDSNDSNRVVSMQNEINRDSFRSSQTPLKNTSHPGQHSAVPNGDVDATQNKVQAHIEGWYQRKLIEAAERLRQNHAYDQPVQDSYEDQVYTSSSNNRQASNLYQSSPHQGWSGRESAYTQNFHRPSPAPTPAYQSTLRKESDLHNRFNSNDNRFEQNGSSPYGYYRSSPYSSDYNYSSDISDEKYRGSDQTMQRRLFDESQNRDFPSYPTNNRNGVPIHYDPVHGSDV